MKRKNTDLEAQVKLVIDEYVMGELDNGGKPLTVTSIARVVNERWEPKESGKPAASPGGVHNIMVKWERMGFITLAHGGERPLTFGAYTDAAREIGLTQLKIKYYNEQKRARIAARKAEG